MTKYRIIEKKGIWKDYTEGHARVSRHEYVPRYIVQSHIPTPAKT